MTEDEYDLERLKAEIVQEKQMKDMLMQSMRELHVTVDELERRSDNVEDENNEWKTRFETQVEMNEQLQQQILSLQDKVEEARRTYKESKLPKAVRPFIEPNEITPAYIRHLEKDKVSKVNLMKDLSWKLDQESKVTIAYVKRLEKEKSGFDGQLRDMEWRLDQESKAYHKANEERKQHLVEINAARVVLDHHRTGGATYRDAERPTPRTHVNANIPQDQRILDPRKGPIRKAAAVKALPRLD